MKKIVYLFFISIVIFSCSSSQETQKTTSQTLKDETINFLALGDSYTIGEGLGKDEIWPYLLYNEIKQKGFSIKQPKIVAQSGWRTDELINAIEKQEINEKYELVSLLIGVNNQFQGRSLEDFKKDFNFLVEKAIRFSKNGTQGVFILSIPDYSVTPFAKNKGFKQATIKSELNQFNQVIYQMALEKNILYFDISDLSRKVESDKSLLTKDLLHPSTKMYKMWVNEIFPTIEQKILLHQGHKPTK